MFSYQEASAYRKYFHWIIMPATDSAPPKIEWQYTYSNADIVVPYTSWAKRVLSETNKTINLFSNIANAGINPDEFYPIEDKKSHQYKFFGKDVSIIGTVMRNQKRKLLPDLMLAFKKYLETLKASGNQELYNKTYLYLHTSHPEENGWNLPELLIEYGIIDKTYFTYVCRNCSHTFAAKFQTSVTCCDHCKERSATVCSPAAGISTAKLNEIYNLFDIYVQYAICEGFGMPQIEAAACGVPIASVDYSAMTEIIENLNGIKIPVQRMFRELETNADRAYPDIDATAKYSMISLLRPQQKKN
jgi:glycosyltransferase involved in cell wall biosynthesis